MRRRVASGAVAATTAVASTVVGMMWPTIDPGVGQWILLGCAVVFGLALIVTLWPDRADAVQSSMGQSTTGSSSHNIQAQGAVHIYHGPAPAPEPVPAVSPWDDPNFSLLDPPRASCPEKRGDMPLEHVLGRLWERTDRRGKGAQEIDRDITNAFVDAIEHYSLAVWGRRKDGQPVERVWPEALKRGEFSYLKGDITYRDPDNAGARHRWYDLKFNGDQIDEWLPPSWKVM